MKNKLMKKSIRFYPNFLYFLLEKWLKKESSKGWHLVKRKAFVYYFAKGKPQKKEYFAWSPTYTGSGKYSIPMRYPNLRDTYGVKKKKSELNKSSSINNDTIIEIDTKWFDDPIDNGYKEMVHDRNHLYWVSFIKNISVIFLFFLITMIVIIVI